MDPSLCVNGCDFYGSAANKNLCSKCYKDYLKQNMITKSSDDERLPESSSSTCQKPCAFERFTSDVGAAIDAVAKKKEKNRCKSCNKKVGLIGFECRCGDVFCGRHRYPEVHRCNCNVNSKEIGRQTLAKQNPLCIHDKLQHRI